MIYLDFARRSVVPLHIKGRKDVDRENWCLSRYLLAVKDRLSFPIVATHALPGESPDFVPESGRQTFGVEITEATTMEFHDQLEISEILGSYSDPNDPGWGGGQPEETNAALVMASVDIVGDTDDLFYDATNRRIYVSGGEGRVTAFRQTSPDMYEVAGQVATAPGARTAFFVPGTQTLYVAVPHRPKQGPEIRVFKVPPTK